MGHEIGPDDPLDAAIEVMAAADSRLIQDTAAQLDPGVVAKVADAIVAAPQGAPRRRLHQRQRRDHAGGTAAPHRHPVLERGRRARGAVGGGAARPQGDVAIGISHRGRTREVMEALAEAGSHGAMTVAVTSFARSPLAELADLVLTTASRETTFRLGGLAAVHSQLFVLDAVYVAVAQRTYERTNEAFELTISAVESHRVERG